MTKYAAVSRHFIISWSWVLISMQSAGLGGGGGGVTQISIGAGAEVHSAVIQPTGGNVPKNLDH